MAEDRATIMLYKKMLTLVGFVALIAITGPVPTSGAVVSRELPKRNDNNEHTPGNHIPTADGMLHFYALPIGQGDSQVIQCPNGDLTVVDLGTAELPNSGFWSASEISLFLDGQFDRIKNVIISHNHADHYSLLSNVLTAERGMTSLDNIYISCTANDLFNGVKNWIADIQAEDKVRLFNGGQPCGPNGVPCDPLSLCPADPDVTVKVMAANLDSCNGLNANVDCVVFKVIYNEVTIMFNGDFEDLTSDPMENGVQRAMVDYYGPELQVTVYKVSRHGGNYANKRHYCAAHFPKAIFASANPDRANPLRCDVIDTFAFELESLCKPLETDPSSEDFCSVHPRGSVSPADRVQQVYTCGNSANINDGLRTVTDNNLAIFTTTPDTHSNNVIEFASDGVNWGFINYIAPRATHY